MITQCPACSTLFRVVPDQLRISEGWVRCGQCGEVFDASLHLLQEPWPEGSGEAPAPRAPGVVPTGTEAAAPPLEPTDDDDDAPASGLGIDLLLDDLGAVPSAAPSASSASSASSAPLPPASPEVPPAGKPQILRVRSAAPAAGTMAGGASGEAAAEVVSPAPAAAPDFSFMPGAAMPSAPASAPSPAPGATSEPPAVAEPFPGSVAQAPAVPEAPAPTADPAAATGPGMAKATDTTSEPAWYAEYKRGFDKAPPDPDDAEFAADPLDDLSFVRSARRRAFWDSTAVRGLLGLLALLLALLLAAQVTLHLRDRLAATVPALKPVLERLCQPLGCVLQPLKQIDAVVIDSTAFSRLGSEAFRLSLTLRNQSGLDVAMPWLELTLTDSGEQPLVRRVLKPDELGSASMTVLGARSEWSASTELSLQGDAALGGRVAGYRLLAFYP